AEVSEAHVLRVVVVRERKGVARVEPAVVGAAPLLRVSDENHVASLEWRPLDRDSELAAACSAWRPGETWRPFDIPDARPVPLGRGCKDTACGRGGGVSDGSRGEGLVVR